MIMKYDKMVAITQAESQRKMNIEKNTISDMLKNMERITVADLVKRTGLSRGFFYKNELIRREMDDAIHRPVSYTHLDVYKRQDQKYVLHLKQDQEHRIILCASSRRIPQYLDPVSYTHLKHAGL